ncbi:MAG: General secretion pathway protein D [Rhodanobacteraceae bacterium]|nr:MAG: General secretion pathway protein D [Rhodanobacteraceae bacterium]
MHKKLATLGIVCTVGVLAGCAPQIRPDTDYSLQRQAIAGTEKPVPQPLDVGNAQENQTLANAAAPQQQYGTGVFINGAAAAQGKSRGEANAGGTITFNFDNQPVQAAVKAILGDVLHANYSIAPDVKGTVTFATSQPVTKDEVLPILQMLLSWTGNALIQQNGRYLVLPIDQAAPGNLVPGLGAVPPGMGYAARLFPLHYVSADAMQKLLKPFADPKAFLLVDPLRNLLVMGGTPDELANYQRIVRTFDVDWLRGMSVAVIPLEHVQAAELVGQLESILSEQVGEKTESPAKVPFGSNMTLTLNDVAVPNAANLSSMVRLIPLKQSNSLVVITPQPSYIDEVRRLVTTIDNGAGNASGLYVYNVLNVKASDLAKHLNELFGNNTNGNTESQNGAVAPGFSPLEQTGQGQLGGQQGFGSFSQNSTFGGGGVGDNGSSDMFGGSGSGGDNSMISGSTQSRRQQQGNQGSVAFTTSEGVRIAAVNENNQLLIRATPSAWQKLLPVIQRLDEKPLQVQIETKVLEVNLTGEFQFGVQYYLGGLMGSQPGSPPTPGVDNAYRRHQGAAGLGGVQYQTTDALFYSFAGNKLQFALSALETSGDAKVLSAPSTVVLNNQETTFKVGEKIPIVQTYLVPGVGIGSTSGSYNAGQVQYIDTGVLLDVVPRVSPGGLVYLDVQQIVSKPSATTDKNGNYTISNRALSTEVAVQSGQTVLLGGLIQQTDSVQDNGVPFLNRIPVLGRLFGTTDRNRDRTELIVLITPRIIRNPEEARQNTNEYETQFESLKPILPASSASSAPASGSSAGASVAAPAETLPANDESAAPPSGGWAVQIASFTSDADAQALRGRLQQLGFAGYVESAQISTGTVWRVRAGPVVSRDAAERLRAVIADSLHLGGMTIVER